jgi:hypothetical protein
VTTSREKGDALELAVAAVEELILRNSPVKPAFERKKIVNVGGVHHEIDLYVTIDPGAGYKSVFIFECKNWEQPVGKNEVIVFSRKIADVQASKGFIVAKNFTSDAAAAAQLDPRIVLMLAREYDPTKDVAPIEFFARFPAMTKMEVLFAKVGSQGLKIETKNFDEVQAKYRGQPVELKSCVVAWSLEACDGDIMTFFNELVPEGVYNRGPISASKPFQRGELFLDDSEIEKVSFVIEYKVDVVKTRLVSHFEIETRGRFFSFAPIMREGEILQWNVVLTYPQAT